MSTPIHRSALLAVALAIGCDYSVWLSGDASAELDATIPDATSLDASVDAEGVDAEPLDAQPPDVGPFDAGPPRVCETSPSIVGAVRATPALERPTFAISGRRASLRYGVLVPPSASPTPTSDTTLILVDRDGAAVGERALRIEGSGGAPASTATLHALSHDSSAEGFLVLGPRGLWVLDADGAGDPIALATPPRPEWQRAAGWVDADRFVFVTDTADLRLAVFDRTTNAVTTTSISVAGAAVVHVEPGGVTVSMAATSETVVYDPDLSGAESLRTTWNDGELLGRRLVAAGIVAGQRIWIVYGTNEFRTDVASHRVSAAGDAVRLTGITLVSPVTASLEGPVIALEGFGPSLAIYSLASDRFTELTPRAEGALVESERDGERVSVLTLLPDATGGLSLELACGVL